MFTFKNKLKEINDQNTSIVKKNLNYFYKSELKRKSDLTGYDSDGKKEKKTFKRQKTIVTESC